MRINLSICFICTLFFTNASAQCNIDHIKTQSYLEYASNINCDSTNGTTMEDRICSNLAFQKADSIMNFVFNKIISNFEEENNDSLVVHFQNTQELWCTYRTEQCASIYLEWTECGGCNTRASTYLDCLTLATSNRNEELEQFIDLFYFHD